MYENVIRNLLFCRLALKINSKAKPKLGWPRQHMPIITALGRPKQKGSCKIEASLGHRVSSWIHGSQDNTKRTRNIPIPPSTVSRVAWETSLSCVGLTKPKLVQLLKQEAPSARIPTEATTPHWAAPATSRDSEKACG